MDIIILLTGCINPNGMSFTSLTDVNERQKQYIHAINYYLGKTNCKIIFCENSNTDICPFFNHNEYKKRLEILTFSGNQDKQRGKGYGEAEIIEYALLHSSFIHPNNIIIKITGRLIVNNVNQILQTLKYKKKDFVLCLFHSDLTFADSRIILATTSFYEEFLHNKNKINDNDGMYFEHVLSSSVLNSSIPYIPLSDEPLITGESGSTGEIYQSHATDTKQRLLYKCYSLMQLLEINKKSNHRHTNRYHYYLVRFNIWRYKLLLKLYSYSF